MSFKALTVQYFVLLWKFRSVATSTDPSFLAWLVLRCPNRWRFQIQPAGDLKSQRCDSLRFQKRFLLSFPQIWRRFWLRFRWLSAISNRCDLKFQFGHLSSCVYLCCLLFLKASILSDLACSLCTKSQIYLASLAFAPCPELQATSWRVAVSVCVCVSRIFSCPSVIECQRLNRKLIESLA